MKDNLKKAIENGRNDSVELLIRNIPDKELDVNEIFLYAYTYNNTETLNYLLSYNIDIPSLVSESGINILSDACVKKKVDVIKFLLSNVSFNEKILQHALIYTCHNGSVEILELLSRYINEYNLDYNGKTPLEVAVRAGKSEMVKYLLENGANRENVYKFIPYAAENGDLETIKYVIEQIVCNDKEYLSKALIMASKKGNIDIVEYLLKNGADVNYTDENTASPIKLAIINKQYSVIKMLLGYNLQFSTLEDKNDAISIIVQSREYELESVINNCEVKDKTVLALESGLDEVSESEMAMNDESYDWIKEFEGKSKTGKIKRVICYICKDEMEISHPFYSKMCIKCGEENLKKRVQQADLTGYNAIVTGGRIKIGYHTALKLLRAGARVLVTTRFPLDAINAYTKEKDYEEWCDRLEIVKLDLKRVDKLDQFIQYVYDKYESLDILINNAAQTERKPRSYSKELEKREAFLSENLSIEQKSHQKIFFDEKQRNIAIEESVVNDSVALPSAFEENENRNHNTWSASPEEISLMEYLEVQLINATAPFLLNSRLKTLMDKSPNQNKFVINVSAVEGIFNTKSKTGYHVHTNMAKAALNMMTRTLSRKYARDGIFMYSIDTGWITNMYPKNWRGYANIGFETPIDSEDGAARILDPIFSWVKNEKIATHGVLMKDYRVVEW